MPTFDFRCSACGHVFEHVRPFGSNEMPTCPACKGTTVAKLITPPAIQFRGTGFYKTDSSTPAKKEKADATKTDNEKEKAESKKSDDKPAEKTSKNGSK